MENETDKNKENNFLLIYFNKIFKTLNILCKAENLKR